MRRLKFSNCSRIPQLTHCQYFSIPSNPHPSPQSRDSRSIQDFGEVTSSPLSIHKPATNPSFLHLNPLQSPTVPFIGRFTDKSVLITGASRGIGAAIARRFAREGARCLLVGRNENLLKKVKEEIESVNDGKHEYLIGDVGDREFWRGLRREEGIDVLVNAAGITHYSPLAATTPDLLEKVVRTNLVGTMLGCRTLGKLMMSNRNGGCIINVASLLGLKGGSGSVAYAASKAGVIGLTRSLAAELGPRGVRVNVIIPGYVETDMTEAMTPQARKDAENAIPMRRFGHTSEIADAAIFLAANTYATNCMLNLDGGLSAM